MKGDISLYTTNRYMLNDPNKKTMLIFKTMKSALQFRSYLPITVPAWIYGT